jgi:SAM-dependent methyltransferase
MAALVHGLDEYRAALDTVAGWLSHLDIDLFAQIDALQRSRAIGGDLLEIGVYHGKSAITLGYLARPPERLVVCDLFMDNEGTTEENRAENERWYEGYQRDDFERTYLRFHTELPTILAISSTDIDADAMAGQFRLIHIDGSHNFEIVRQDIRTAERLLGPGGVVVCDDWSTPHNPGSALAVWEEVLGGRLVPLCITDAKLYATWDPEVRDWADELEAWARARGDLVVEHHLLFGWTVRRFHPLPPPPASPAPPPEPEPPREPIDEVAGPRWRAVVRALAPPLVLQGWRRLSARRTP